MSSNDGAAGIQIMVSNYVFLSLSQTPNNAQEFHSLLTRSAV